MRPGVLLVMALSPVIAGAGLVRTERADLPVCSMANLRPRVAADGADWIGPPVGGVPDEGRFLRFRRSFSADGQTPLELDVSADERFVLLLDGEPVARGPDRGGGAKLWFAQAFRTVPTKGEHKLEAVVWKLNAKAPNAQLTWRADLCGFVLKASGPFDVQLTTGTARWRVAELRGTRATRVAYPFNPVGTQYDVTGTGFLDEEPSAADWRDAVIVRKRVAEDPNGAESYLTAGWTLYPSQLPDQVSRKVRPVACRAADDQTFPTNGVWCKAAEEWGSNAFFTAASAIHPDVARMNALLASGTPVKVAAGTKIRFLLDLGNYFCGYPELRLHGGKGARLRWRWAEALYEGDCFDWHTLVEPGHVRKGDSRRDEFVGKYFYGIADVFRPDGRAKAVFTVPWWRSGRWCLLEIETASEPLELAEVSIVESRYPFEPTAEFSCSDASVAPVRDLCVRGLQMCFHDMVFDCPHYEQQMYSGDARVQLLTASAMSADSRLQRQAFRLLESSQREDGLFAITWPSQWSTLSPTYSMVMALMLGDYALWRDEPDWVRARMPSIRKLLFGLERYADNEGLLDRLPGWPFMDWVPDWKNGVAPDGRAGEGVSSVNNLLYLLALRSAATIEEYLGEPELAARWRRRAEGLSAAINRVFWCERRGLVADTRRQDRFSEHAQCLAILGGALSPERARRAFDGLVTAPGLARCTVYFSHYLFDAYCQRGRADLFMKRLDLWRDFVRQGLKTPLEAPGDARSDCHGWGAHPLYHLQAGVAGVRPLEPGFKSVLVAPQPCGLQKIVSVSPTPRGDVKLSLETDGASVRGVVTLPDSLPGVFRWKGEDRPLKAGQENRIDIQQKD